MNYFITGIGTNVGKTVVSAILTEMLQADYWKPIQSGTIEGKDSDIVESLITNSKTVIHPESYLLKEPLSPHFAAKLEKVEIDLNEINIPVRLIGVEANHLIIEGAGGILVPINQSQYVIDIAKKFECEIILVIINYLGCINHTLLSIDYLLKNKYTIKALVFNGEFESEIKLSITNYIQNVLILDIPTLNTLSKLSISEVSNRIKTQFL